VVTLGDALLRTDQSQEGDRDGGRVAGLPEVLVEKQALLSDLVHCVVQQPPKRRAQDVGQTRECLAESPGET
jgi:hypothetical protein